MNASTQRVQRYRQRQAEARRKRITLYLDQETQRQLGQLVGDQAQAAFLEKIVRAAIKREWSALVSTQREGQGQQNCNHARNPLIYPGRRRSLVRM